MFKIGVGIIGLVVVPLSMWMLGPAVAVTALALVILLPIAALALIIARLAARVSQRLTPAAPFGVGLPADRSPVSNLIDAVEPSAA